MINPETPLYTAAYGKNRQKVNDWMQYGQVNPALGDGILCAAVISGSIDIITDLVERYNANINNRDYGNATILHLALRTQKSVPFCQALLARHGASHKEQEKRNASKQILDIDAQTSYGDTALNYAFEYRYPDIFIQQLLSLSPNIWLANNAGTLPIHYAAEQGRLSVVKALLSLDPKQAHAEDNEGYTPLHHAINGMFYKRSLMRLRIIQILLDENGVNLSSSHNLGRALYKMWNLGYEREKNERVEKELLKRLRLPKPQEGKHPFLDALYAGQYEMLLPNVYLYNSIAYSGHHEILIPATLYPGWQPIHYAASMFPEAFDPLVKYYPIDIQARTAQEGYTVLHCAARYGKRNILNKLMRRHKMDINLRDKEGFTALHVMLQQGYIFIDFFADNKANMQAITNNGWNALHFAVKKSPWYIIRRLIEDHHIDPHQVTKEGNTALHIAAQHGQAFNMWVLIYQFGLDPHAKNHAQKTPADLAREAGYEDVLFVLESDKNIHLLDQNCKLPPITKRSLFDRDAVTEEINTLEGWCSLSSVGDLLYAEENREPYPELIPILVKHLNKKYPCDTQEDMVRALCVPEAKGLACPALIKLYHKVPLENFDLRWNIGYTVSVVATQADIPSILNIVQEAKNGPSREMFVVALRHLKATESIPVLQALLEDESPMLRLEATRALESFDNKK